MGLIQDLERLRYDLVTERKDQLDRKYKPKKVSERKRYHNEFLSRLGIHPNQSHKKKYFTTNKRTSITVTNNTSEENGKKAV